MLQILLCVLMNVGIFVCFRLFSVFNMNTLQAIVFNYITCVFTGLLFIGGGSNHLAELDFSSVWVLIAAVLGGVFVGTFYLMARTTQKFSITVSSVATKMSLVIPVLFSLLVLGIQSKNYTLVNYLGMGVALVAILMSSYKEKKIKTDEISGFDVALPLFIFLLGGIIDSAINFTNHHFLTTNEERVFPVLIFTSASVIGIAILLVKKSRIKIKNVIGGAALGIVNYFSIYFLITSLSAFANDGALVYPLINVGIILIAAVVSVIFFKERLSRINLGGLVLALLSILLISYQELYGLI